MGAWSIDQYCGYWNLLVRHKAISIHSADLVFIHKKSDIHFEQNMKLKLHFEKNDPDV